MSDGDILQSAIAADPSDHTLQLARADWLEENGYHEEAESLRTQVELIGAMWAIRIDRSTQEIEDRFHNIYHLSLPVSGRLEVVVKRRAFIPPGTEFGPVQAEDILGRLWSCRVFIEKLYCRFSRPSQWDYPVDSDKMETHFFAISHGTITEVVS